MNQKHSHCFTVCFSNELIDENKHPLEEQYFSVIMIARTPSLKQILALFRMEDFQMHIKISRDNFGVFPARSDLMYSMVSKACHGIFWNIKLGWVGSNRAKSSPGSRNSRQRSAFLWALWEDYDLNTKQGTFLQNMMVQICSTSSETLTSETIHWPEKEWLDLHCWLRMKIAFLQIEIS